jgi:hypothetical protein
MEADPPNSVRWATSAILGVPLKPVGHSKTYAWRAGKIGPDVSEPVIPVIVKAALSRLLLARI